MVKKCRCSGLVATNRIRSATNGEKMTIKEVEKRVQAIRENVDDPESAHADEDNLYLDVLKAVARGSKHSIKLAKEAIKTRNIDFPRWYA